jgi:UMF1 family MFS transporter
VEDAVTTVILNIGIYCSIVLGMAEGDITLFLVVSTISAVIGSFLIGHLARKYALKRLLYVVIWGWLVSLLLFVVVDHPVVVWTLGSMVGVLLGGLWTTTRPMLAELAPREELGRFFGLFALSGRAAAVVGPLVWTVLVYLFRPGHSLGDGLAGWLQLGPVEAARLPYRIGVLSLVAMMVLGLVILRKVPYGKVDHGL